MYFCCQDIEIETGAHEVSQENIAGQGFQPLELLPYRNSRIQEKKKIVCAQEVEISLPGQNRLNSGHSAQNTEAAKDALKMIQGEELGARSWQL